MKKLFSFCVALFATTALWAYDFESNGLCYNITSSEWPYTVEVTYGYDELYNNKYANLNAVTIPETVTNEGTTYSVTSIGEGAFSGCSGLTSITIPNSVTSIGDYAFDGCTGITSVVWNAKSCSLEDGRYDSPFSASASQITSFTFGNEVESIPDYLCRDLSNLSTIIIPEGVTSIGDWAFDGCTGITSVVWNAKSCSLDNGYNPFSAIASQITSFTFGNEVDSIPAYLCRDMSNLSTIIIPEGVTSIGDWAFDGCTGITSVVWNAKSCSLKDGYYEKPFSAIASQITSFTFGNEVESIPAGLCRDMSNLSTITIPNSVTSVGDLAFGGCINLTEPVHNDTLFVYMPTSYSGDYSIPDGIKHVMENAFYDCSGLTSITIPNSVTSIESGAFSDCAVLTSIVVESGNTVYDSRNNCNAIIETATNTLICGCSKTSIPNSVTSIGNNAFEDCTGLTSITIPNSVTSIGDGVFVGCTGLTSITIPNSVTSIGYVAFHGCTGLTSITIPNSVTSIEDGVFVCCTGLTSITIPNSVTSIGDNAFTYCTGLTSITIPNSVTSIGGGAFSDCTGLTSITIPNSVTNIESGAFEGCSGLTSIVVESGNTVYDSRNNCNAIIETATNTLICGCSKTSIPNSVTTIREYAFDGCTGLTSITIPNSVTSIGDYAFFNVPNIVYSGTATGSPWGARSVNGFVDGYLVYEDATKTTLLACSSAATGAIEIPNSVTSIGYLAFSGCSGLTSITIPNSVTSIGEGAFDGCTGLTKITILANTPPSTDGDLEGSDATLYVPCDALEEYRNHRYWGNFADFECIDATEIKTNDEIMVETTANSVALAWPQDSQAASYTLVISKDGVVFCTLTFNGSGQLMGIAFAPSSDGTTPAQAAEATVSGYQFTVTGLDEASSYTYSLTVKDAAGNVLHTYTGAFATDGATGLNNTTIADIYTENGRIVCAGEYQIFDLLGRDVTRMNGQLNGVYIVKSGDKAQKVVVR